jgi:hypothetical protein
MIPFSLVYLGIAYNFFLKRRGNWTLDNIIAMLFFLFLVSQVLTFIWMFFAIIIDGVFGFYSIGSYFYYYLKVVGSLNITMLLFLFIRVICKKL